MANYLNPRARYPLPFRTDIPGIALPKDFALEAADRSLNGPNLPNGRKPKAIPAPEGDSIRFPLRDRQRYGKAIARLVESFSGPGFNLIFRPHSDQSENHGKDLDLLELNLTHELWTFPTLDADLGDVPNRVATTGAPKDVILHGIPYTQLVRDVTANTSDKVEERGKRIPVDRLGKNSNEALQNMIQDIHFEPGLFMHVENSLPVSNEPTINRMASIPHGTTINAQGPAAEVLSPSGRAPDIPLLNPNASMPFLLSNGTLDDKNFSEFFNLTKETKTRLPKNGNDFLEKNSIESITKDMVKDPNELLRKHNEGKKFTEVIKFTVSTVPTEPLKRQACPHLAARAAMTAAQKALDGVKSKEADAARTKIMKALEIVTEPPAGAVSEETAKAAATAPFGSANIAFLDGDSDGGPNARTGKVDSTFWISTVEYTLNVTERFIPGNTPNGKAKILQLKPEEFGKFPTDTVPEFIFPTDKEVLPGRYKVEATQIQYSQNVSLIFNARVWPHISVATIIPVRPVLVKQAILDTSNRRNQNELRL